MLGALWKFLGVKGFLIALAGVGIFVTSVYGLGRMHGYESYKAKAESLREAALVIQRAQDQSDHEVQMSLALTKQRAKYDLQNLIRGVQNADGDCELAADSLRWADDILGAATTDIERTDPPATD